MGLDNVTNKTWEKKKVPIFCDQDMKKGGHKDLSVFSACTLLHSLTERHEILCHII